MITISSILILPNSYNCCTLLHYIRMDHSQTMEYVEVDFKITANILSIKEHQGNKILNIIYDEGQGKLGHLHLREGSQGQGHLPLQVVDVSFALHREFLPRKLASLFSLPQNMCLHLVDLVEVGWRYPSWICN